MDFFTHFLIAVLISIFTLNSMPLSIIMYACIMAILADLDIFFQPLKKITKSNLLAHKGISHSIFYSGFISAVIGGIFSVLMNESFILAWLIGFLFYDLHIFLDFLTASKIPLFYPITKKRFRFFIDRAINFYLALISGSIILFSIIAFFFYQDFFSPWVLFLLNGFYLIYFIFRMLVKFAIMIKYPKNHKFVPGVNPFSYLNYFRTETEDFVKFELNFKNLFKKKPILILKSIIKKNSLKNDLFIKASNLLNLFPFGEKWDAIIPIFEDMNDFTVLKIYFSESYFNGHYYSIQFIFDKISYDILKVNESFNRKHKNSNTFE